MELELRTRWLEALRGGQYKQGRYRLNDGRGGYCCLGVLADIQNMEWTPVENGFTIREDDSENVSLPPLSMLKEWGLLQHLPGYSFKPYAILAAMNDGKYTFNQIADWIEENL